MVCCIIASKLRLRFAKIFNMKKVLLLAFISIFTLNLSAQDIGVGELIYPKKNFEVFETSSYVPVYWNFKNYGDDTLENRIITLELLAEGSSPRFTQFRANITKDFVGPLDDREPLFYQYGFNELFGIQGVMGIITPEAAPGDTIDICVVATVEGDVDHSNDTACFSIVLKEWKNRDLVMHILNPQPKSEVHPNHSVTFELSVRNDGSEIYDHDSLYMQMAFEKDGETMDLVNISNKLNGSIEPGDSAIVSLNVPLSNKFPLGDFYVGFRVAWLSEDKVYELGESNSDNNIRYTTLTCTASSLAELPQLNLQIKQMNNAIIVNGDFESANAVTSRIISISGKTVASKNALVNGNSQLVFNTNSFDKGIYLLIIEADNGKVFSNKVFVD